MSSFFHDASKVAGASNPPWSSTVNPFKVPPNICMIAVLFAAPEAAGGTGFRAPTRSFRKWFHPCRQRPTLRLSWDEEEADSSLAPVAASLVPVAAASSNPLPVTVRLAAHPPEGM